MKPIPHPLEYLTLSLSTGVTLDAVASGPKDGPLLVLLHGFPETWRSWKHQIPYFARLGYRVIAPNQRGYAGSSKPAAIRDYTLDQLAEDIVALIKSQGRRTARVAGHDWGAAVTWWLATFYPDAIEKAAVLNVPHPKVMAKRLPRDLGQLARSWYVLFFQLPRIPEALLSARGFALLKRTLRGSSRRGTFSAQDLQAYHDAWSIPGALTSMIHYYRGARKLPRRRLREAGRIRVPLIVLWGARDAFLKPELARASLQYCDNGKLEYREEATHWLQHEEPEWVNDQLARFFKAE